MIHTGDGWNACRSRDILVDGSARRRVWPGFLSQTDFFFSPLELVELPVRLL